MKDQVAALRQKGIVAACLYSGQTMAEKRQAFAEISSAQHALLYLSPERVQKEGFAQWVKRQKIGLFAIDEAHCISQWGPDFREDYHKLSLLRELRPDIPILALTATATPVVLRDIITQLHLREPDRHVHGFYRPNLYYQIEACDSEDIKFPYILQALRQIPKGRALIYCGTRQRCEGLAESLSMHFEGVAFYHAGMSTEDRTRVQEEFASGVVRILVATNAFGMGVDHPDVRLVAHYQMPANVESYYQEVGRAGRDGLDSTCLLLYSRKDRALQVFFIRESKADANTLKRRWRSLDTMTQFLEGGECRHAGILTYFKDSHRLKACGHCDVCAPESPRRVRIPAEMLAVPAPKPKRSAKSPSKKSLSDEPLSKEAELRQEILREWRKEYADARDIPAFLVFSNKTLRDLAVKAPQSSDELLKVYGMGPAKVEHFGGELLQRLRELQ
jgi:ATP-dependent DNA helicase RecQ